MKIFAPAFQLSARLRTALLFFCLLVSHAVSSALLEFDEYLQRADAARTRGDWESVANQYAQAINHPDLPRDGAMRSRVNLEYGRALGVICQFAEAEKFLLRAKDIAEKSQSPMFSVLYELGSISVAQKKYSEASAYFVQLLPLMDRDPQAKNSSLKAADAYEKFAEALAATGKADEAAVRRADAARVRDSKLKPALPGTITPYGAQCPK